MPSGPAGVTNTHGIEMVFSVKTLILLLIWLLGSAGVDLGDIPSKTTSNIDDIAKYNRLFKLFRS